MSDLPLSSEELHYDDPDVRKVIRKAAIDIPELLFDVFQEYCTAEPSGDLGHYTNNTGLVGIVKSRSIFCTNVRYLNDASEFTYGIQLLNEIKAASDDSDPSPAARAAILLLSEKTALVNRKLISARNGLERLASDYFVTSFSEKTNQLSQWRAYSGGIGGYCLVFDSSQLKDAALNSNARVVQCIYDETKQIAILFDFLHAVWKKVTLCALDNRDEAARAAILNSIRYFLEISISQALAILKHPNFHEESEWRLVVRPVYSYPTVDQRNSQIRFRAGEELVVPYVDFNFGTAEKAWPSGLINKVIVGPSRHPELAKESIERFLWFEQLGNAKVENSDIPFRPLH